MVMVIDKIDCGYFVNKWKVLIVILPHLYDYYKFDN